MVCRLFLVFLMGFLSIRADDSDDGPPVPAQVSPPRCKSLLDVVAVVDGSDSIDADDFGQLKSALESLVTDLNVKPDNTHLGIILFSANITHKIELSGDAANLISKIRSLEHPRDGTNTALAIEEMNGMVSRLRRPGAPIVGIVITDGISKDPISTAQQAVVSRDMGINMVAIGVGTKVDELELQSIASNGQVLTTAHFNQIGAILGNLVQVACPTTTTTTTTTTPVPTTIMPTTTPTTTTTTTTTAAPTPTRTIKPGPCSGCKMSNGIGYNPHSIDCRKYIQCEFGLNGVITPVVRECSHGLFWDQDLLNCNYPAAVQCAADPCKNMHIQTYKSGGNCREYYGCVNGSSVGQCCAKGNAYVSGRCVYNQGCNADCSGDVANTVCDKRSVTGNKRAFEQKLSDYNWIPMPCAPGTAYSPKECRCTILVDSVAIPSTHRCRRIVYLPFDNDVSDQSGNGNYVENIGVTVSGGSGYFDGKSGLRIPRFANVEFGSKFVIKMTYRKDGVSDTQEALVSNGDCGKPQTLLIATYKQKTLFGLHPVTGKPRAIFVPSTVGWNNIIFKIQDKHLSGSVNGNEARTPYDGDVKRSQCALQIGRGTGLNNFRGYIDEFSVYMC